MRLIKKFPEKAINRCSEYYGACRHRACFHRLELDEDQPGTNESNADEKVQEESQDWAITPRNVPPDEQDFFPENNGNEIMLKHTDDSSATLVADEVSSPAPSEAEEPSDAPTSSLV